jgi:hypothetical protein
MPTTRWIIRLGVCLFFSLAAGCSRDEVPAPGVTYGVSLITKGTDGKAKQQGPVRRVESAVVEDEEQFTHEGRTVVLQVRKTQDGKATFDIIFPDHSNQRVQVKAGEPKTILPKGQTLGVRIEVEESH